MKTILVLAPHPDLAEGIRAALNPEQYRVVHRSSLEEAEPLLKRAIAIREEVLGPKHSNTAFSLNNLAYNYNQQGKYEEAEPLYE